MTHTSPEKTSCLPVAEMSASLMPHWRHAEAQRTPSEFPNPQKYFRQDRPRIGSQARWIAQATPKARDWTRQAIDVVAEEHPVDRSAQPASPSAWYALRA